MSAASRTTRTTCSSANMAVLVGPVDSAQWLGHAGTSIGTRREWAMSSQPHEKPLPFFGSPPRASRDLPRQSRRSRVRVVLSTPEGFVYDMRAVSRSTPTTKATRSSTSRRRRTTSAGCSRRLHPRAVPSRSGWCGSSERWADETCLLRAGQTGRRSRQAASCRQRSCIARALTGRTRRATSVVAASATTWPVNSAQLHRHAEAFLGQRVGCERMTRPKNPVVVLLWGTEGHSPRR